ncbi:MAG: GNAT family N-acetyltransferase [Candidatus Dormibacteria bacterium]|jgi:predicted acetyltransferase
MEVEIRPIGPGEEEAFLDVLSAAFGQRHTAEAIAADVADAAGVRCWMALTEGRPIGVAGLIGLQLTMPGGARLPLSGVTEVGVLPTHRRRGVLRRLMGVVLDDARERGHPVAGLMASEAPIYGRFGFGAAERVARVEVDTGGASFREPPTDTGQLEVVEASVAVAELPRLHETVCAARNGMVSRPLFRHHRRYRDASRELGGFDPMRFALHRDAAGGVDGLLAYRTRLDWDASPPRADLQVHELWAATDESETSLWRMCLEHDLITRVSARWRPADGTVAGRLTDPRAWRQTLSDGLWVRPLDPAVLLAARRYGREDGLVLEVHEPEGSAPRRLRLEGGLDGATCVASTASPDLRLGVAALGSICLGDAPVERLHRAGQIGELSPGAVARATAMFGWSPAPWSGDIF